MGIRFDRNPIATGQHHSPRFWLALLTVTLFLGFFIRGIGFFPTENGTLMLIGGYLVWKKRSSLQYHSGPGATALGLVMILWVSLRTLLCPFQDTDILTQHAPLLGAIGLGLLASGFRGLGQYATSLICLFFAVFPLTVLINFPSITTIDAQLSTYILWYLGFDVVRDGQQVLLPGGGIDIYPGCSSLGLFLILLKLTLALSFLLPFRPKDYLKLLGICVGLSFLTNGIRLCLMAILIAQGNGAAFDYVHSPSGASLFSTGAIVLLGILCHLISERSLGINP